MTQRKIFKGNINNIIRKILETNELKEYPKDYLEKVNERIKPFFDILYRATNDFAIKGGKEELFLSDVQKELNISEQAAKNMLKEVKEKILPLVMDFNDEDDEGEKEKEKIVIEKTNILSEAPVKRIPKKTAETSRNDRYREPLG
jgi:histone H3/H4